MRPIADRRPALLLVLLAGCSVDAPAPRHESIAFDTTAWRTDLASWQEVRSAWVAGPFGPLSQVAVCRIAETDAPTPVTGSDGGGCSVRTVPGLDTLAVVMSSGDTATLDRKAGAFWVGERSLRTNRVLSIRDRVDIDGAIAWLGPLQLSARWTDGVITVWVGDTTAEAREAFRGLAWWPPNPALRIPARFEPREGRWERVPTIRGYELPREIVGTLVLEIRGVPYRLTLYGKGRGARSMLAVIRDETSGIESYPAGRFVDVPMPDSTGQTVIDFNLARNPDCAFTIASACPLPPRENWITDRLEAGERTYPRP